MKSSNYNARHYVVFSSPVPCILLC